MTAAATIRSDNGSRPNASAISTSNAPMQLRTVGPGQQGIADAGKCCDRRRHQGQANPQRQPWPQGEELDRQQVSRRDHRADMEPADREQVGQSRIAHRLIVGHADGPAIAAGESRCDRTLRSR
jgi:hypothetical protein